MKRTITKTLPVLLAGLLCNEVMAQQTRFPVYIGMYSYDRDNGPDDHVSPQESVGLDDAYLAEMTKYHFNLIISGDPSRTAITSSNQNLLSTEFLNRVQNAGLKIIVGNYNFAVNKLNPVYYPAEVALGLGHYNSHPAVIGYDIIDEPCMMDFPVMGQVANQITTYDNTKMPYVNLWSAPADHQLDDCNANTNYTGTYADYLDAYIANTNPKMIGFDFYPLETDPGENSYKRDYFMNLQELAVRSASNNIPFYLTVNTYQNTGLTGTNADFHGIDDMRILRYNMFSGLVYGAKGLMYWPREIAIGYVTGPFVVYPFQDDMSTTTKQKLGDINKKILDHSFELGNLKFVSSYHVTALPQVAVWNTAWIGQMYNPEMEWSQFTSDAATITAFNTSNPITPAPTLDVHNPNGSDFLAFSYLSDAGGKKYMWVMNKDYHGTGPVNFTLNFNGPKVVVDILEDQTCTNISSMDVELEAGEGKLFLIDTYYYQNMTMTAAFPSLNFTMAADNLTMQGNQVTGTSVDRFYAKHITVTPSAYFAAGTDVLLKAENNYCGVFRAPFIASTDKRAPDLRVVPNPNNGNFTVKIDGDAEKVFDISVETILGQVVYRTRQAGKSQAEIDLRVLPDGMYLVKLTADGDVMKTIKTIVSH